MPCIGSPSEHAAGPSASVGVHLDAVLHEHQVARFGLDTSGIFVDIGEDVGDVMLILYL